MSWTDQTKKAWNNSWAKGNRVGSALTIADGIIGIAGAGAGNAQIADTSAIENNIADTKYAAFDYGDYDSLVSAFNSNALQRDNYTRQDIRGLTDGQIAFNTLKGIGKGTISGLTVGGPWGAVAGAALGLGSGVAGMFKGNAEADTKAVSLNNKARESDNLYLANVARNGSNISDNMFNIKAFNISANGGKIKTSLPKYYGFDDYFAYGGNLNLSGEFSNGVTLVESGGTHEQNKYEGVPMGMDENGIPNLVEEGEVIYNDYVFSRRLKPTKSQLREVLLNPKYEGKTFAEIAKLIQKESSENPIDPISRNTLDDGMMKLMTIQEMTRSKNNINKFAIGGRKYDGLTGDSILKKYSTPSWVENFRYAPAVASGLQVLSDVAGWSNKNDYTNPSIIRDASRKIRNVSSRPIGATMTYTPFDFNYEQNRLANQSLATRDAILASTSGNRGAAIGSLLALNNATNSQMGDLMAKIDQANNAQRQQVAQFNANVAQANSQLGMQADARNQAADLERINAAVREAVLRDQIESATSSAKSANLTNFENNLGNVGLDKYYDRSAFDWIRALGLEDQYKNYVLRRDKGGKIKRGLTF